MVAIFIEMKEAVTQENNVVYLCNSNRFLATMEICYTEEKATPVFGHPLLERSVYCQSHHIFSWDLMTARKTRQI